MTRVTGIMINQIIDFNIQLDGEDMINKTLEVITRQIVKVMIKEVEIKETNILIEGKISRARVKAIYNKMDGTAVKLMLQMTMDLIESQISSPDNHQLKMMTQNMIIEIFHMTINEPLKIDFYFIKILYFFSFFID